MTEDEAKKKWCPMVRVGEGSSTDNRNCSAGIVNKNPGEGSQWNCCIASSCMMWRCADSYFSTTTGTVRKPDTGYCGLGGKP
jgi:hypothetical protein